MKCDVVFEGGGAKGIALVGAWQEFTQRGYTFNRIIGTSAGAIMAAFLAAGFSTQELYGLLTQKEEGKSVFNKFLGVPQQFNAEAVDKSYVGEWLKSIQIPFVPDPLEEQARTQIVNGLMGHPLFRHVFSFVELGGWYTADYFVAWLIRELNRGEYKGKPRRFGELTLSQFYAKTKAEFSVTASDTTGGRLLILNHRTAPNLPLVWAVRMSMSIPFLWQEVVWRPEWGNYAQRPLAGHTIVDGGVLSNFPMELLLSALPHVTDVMGPKGSEPVVGFLLDDDRPVEDVLAPAPVPRGVKLEEVKTLKRLRGLVDAALGAHDKLILDSYQGLVVRLPARDYGVTEFDMSDERRDRLVKAATIATSQHLVAHPPGSTPRGTASAVVALGQPTIDRLATNILSY